MSSPSVWHPHVSPAGDALLLSSVAAAAAAAAGASSPASAAVVAVVLAAPRALPPAGFLPLFSRLHPPSLSPRLAHSS